MEDKLIESEFITEKVTNKSKHLAIFSLITIVLVILANIIGQDFNQRSIEMIIIDLISLIEIPLISIIIFRTYKTKKKLKFDSKVGFISIIVLVKFISISIINLINPFNRIINTDDIIKGLIVNFIFSVFTLVLCLPILALIKNKTIVKNV